jgi:hypothetical protein
MCGLGGMLTSKARPQAAEKQEKIEPMVAHPHFLGAVDDKTAAQGLPQIEADGVAECKHEKNGYGDLIVKDGEVLLDFWKRKLKMTIRRDCILVEQADSKKQMFAREDLPKKFHSLYMFAAKMVEALKQKQRAQGQTSNREMRGSQTRMSPQEMLIALSHKSKGLGSSVGTNFQLASSSILKVNTNTQKASLRHTTSRS